LAEGPGFQLRLWRWALRHGQQGKGWVIGEGAACVALTGLAVALVPVTPVFQFYVAVMVVGSWVIPLVTAYLPHDPAGVDFPTNGERGVRGYAARSYSAGDRYPSAECRRTRL
jgi:beta-carotene hydroxylase